MTINRLHAYDVTRHRLAHAVVFVVVMVAIGLQSHNARATQFLPDDVRVGKSMSKFDETTQIGVAFKLRPPRRLRSRYLELAFGALATSSETHAFVSLGPVWTLPIREERLFLKYGFSPTLLSGSTFGDRDIGGSFHITSSVSLEAALGLRRALSLALRIQHISNGGLNSLNPGMDIVALNISYIAGN